MLRRPLLYAACGSAAAAFSAYHIGIFCSAAAAAAGVLLLCVLNRRQPLGERHRMIARILLVFYCLSILSYGVTDWRLDTEGRRLISTDPAGTVTDFERKVGQTGDPYIQLTVKSQQGRFLARCYDTCTAAEKAFPGCRVKIYGKPEIPDGRRNPGCFDYARYLRSSGITAVVTAKKIDVDMCISPKDDPVLYAEGRICRFREAFIDELEAASGEDTAAVMRAVMFGDKGEMDEEVLESFQKNGTAHILAVSGLHIGIIYAFILKLWRWRRGWLFLIFNAVFFMAYAAAAGFSPSVTRAVLMVLLHITANLTSCRYDLSNAAFLILTLVLLRNPFMLFNTGFQMSFLAVLTMTLVLPYISRWYSGVFLASIAVQAGLGPFMMYSFNYISLLAVLINVPVVGLASLLVPSGLLCMAVSGTVLFEGTSRIVRILCGLLEQLNSSTQIDGITSFQVSSPPLLFLGFYYLCLLVFATEEGRLAVIRASHKMKYVIAKSILILFLSLAFSACVSDGFEQCDLTFVDVGQGDCACLQVDGILPGRSRCYLFDGGGSDNYNVGKSILRNYLLKNGMRKVDGAFVTHLHTDHYKGICELSREGMVDKLYLYEAEHLNAAQIQADTGLSAEDIVYLSAGDRLLLDEGSVSVDVLYPDRRTDSEYRELLSRETDENSRSLIFRITFSGRESSTSVLITGDLGEEGEKELLRRHRSDPEILHADILKAGHHGSKTSTSEGFLDAVRTDTAVIQVGKNNMYGHPTPEVLDRLALRGIEVYRTDLMGAVGFEIEQGEVRDTVICIGRDHDME